MTVVRTIAWSLIAAAIIAGGVHDDAPARSRGEGRPQVSGDIVIAGDFHVHAFPGDGMLPPWEVAREGRRRGLDVVTFTSHNQLWAAALASLVAPAPGDPLIITGQEITARGFHMIGVGLTQVVDWYQSASETIDAVQGQGGAAIAAHPVKYFWPGYDAPAMARIDGAELQHPLIEVTPSGGAELRTFYDTAKAQNPRLAAIGSSDFHFGPLLGRCRTYLLVRELTTSAVVDAIRNGRTVAADKAGNLYGDPELVALVRPYAESAGRPRHPRPLQTASALMVLAGLALVVLFR